MSAPKYSSHLVYEGIANWNCGGTGEIMCLVHFSSCSCLSTSRQTEQHKLRVWCRL